MRFDKVKHWRDFIIMGVKTDTVYVLNVNGKTVEIEE